MITLKEYEDEVKQHIDIGIELPQFMHKPFTMKQLVAAFRDPKLDKLKWEAVTQNGAVFLGLSVEAATTADKVLERLDGYVELYENAPVTWEELAPETYVLINAADLFTAGYATSEPLPSEMVEKITKYEAILKTSREREQEDCRRFASRARGCELRIADFDKVLKRMSKHKGR